MNPMQQPRISKLTVNMGVGESGEKLNKAVKVMENMTNQKPIKTITQKKIPAFDIRPGMPIGCKVTLRGKNAIQFLKKALEAVDNKLKKSNFDNTGNFAFGIQEHIDLEGMRYDPELGVFGMNICVTLEKPGYRVKRKKYAKKIGKNHRVTKQEALEFVKKIGAEIQ